MGYYLGQREHPCPRCGGVVLTVFISVGSMSFDEQCASCGTSDFTLAEVAALGANVMRPTVTATTGPPASVTTTPGTPT